MSKCLSSIDHSGNRKEREKMEKKNNEGKEDWLEFYKLTILPLVMWKIHAFLYKKNNVISKKMYITYNYK